MAGVNFYSAPVQEAYEKDPRLALAQALMARGTHAQPLQHWTQGAANLLNQYAGMRNSSKLREEYGQKDEQYRQGQSELVKALMGSSGERDPQMQQIMQSIQSNPMMASQALPIAMGNYTAQRAAAARATEPYTLSEGQKRFVGTKEVASGGEKLPEGMIAGPNGPQFMPAYLQGKKDIASSGRTNVNVNTDKSFGTAVAKNVADRMDAGAQKAQSAVQTLNAANQIDAALATGKVIAGTGANIRLNAVQLADTLGIGGNSNEEKLTNTRATMQGLARLALEGRQMMTGQGAISNAESALAERVSGGDISLTPVEMKMLTGAARRSSEFLINSHNDNVERLKKDPNLSGLAPYYQVIPMQKPQNPQGSSGGKWEYLGPEQ